jgi:hypothetical protein
MRPRGLRIIAVAGVLMVGAIGGYASGERGLRGDVNCDGVVDFGDINPFVLLLSDRAAWAGMYPDCLASNGDINLDGVADFGDINPFVALLAGAHVGEVFHTDCWEARDGERGWCPADVIVLTVEGGTLHTDHQNVEYNCCLEDIVVTLTVQGDLVRLDEEEITPEPCWCMCCNEVWATVEGLLPGTYTVQYCWLEADTNQVECYTDIIVIP